MAAVIREAAALGPGLRAVWLEAPEAAQAAVPGQFVMVEGGPRRITRRPFSVSGIDREQGLIRLLVRVVGPASAWVGGLSPGQPVGLHGPLGRGFTLPPAGACAWVVGGGVGTAPLLFLAAELRRAGGAVWAALGGRTADEVVGADELKRSGAGVAVATEDGSAGERGLVTTLVERRLAGGGPPPATVYACGPRGMLVAVARRALEAGLRCQVSVEERMACGVGACAGCTWPDGRLAPDLALRRLASSREAPGEGGGGGPLRVCRDGPCFEVVRA
ncbi:MAG: dihydroorotate dehydrogenase electron transfer subunit [Bacillota bacterium]|nr:dihydroorotate dehydrogenase electron transfer subunit [Bacillota bacterium]